MRRNSRRVVTDKEEEEDELSLSKRQKQQLGGVSHSNHHHNNNPLVQPLHESLVKSEDVGVDVRFGDPDEVESLSQRQQRLLHHHQHQQQQHHSSSGMEAMVPLLVKSSHEMEEDDTPLLTRQQLLGEGIDSSQLAIAEAAAAAAAAAMGAQDMDVDSSELTARATALAVAQSRKRRHDAIEDNDEEDTKPQADEEDEEEVVDNDEATDQEEDGKMERNSSSVKMEGDAATETESSGGEGDDEDAKKKRKKSKGKEKEEEKKDSKKKHQKKKDKQQTTTTTTTTTKKTASKKGKEKEKKSKENGKSKSKEKTKNAENEPKAKKPKKEVSKSSSTTETTSTTSTTKTTKASATIKMASASSSSSVSNADAESETATVYKWWEKTTTTTAAASSSTDGDEKSSEENWQTLSWKGVIFPPEYKPHGIKMLYDGQPLDLNAEEEEVATMFAVMLDTDYASKPAFQKNFFRDWKKILSKNTTRTIQIDDFDKCDFSPINTWYKAQKEAKKNVDKDQKKAEKERKLKEEEPYMYALIDGRKEKLGNFHVEPPGLFRGRGEHPKMGTLKERVLPEDVVVNCGPNDTPPVPPAGHQWKQVVHNNRVTWLAFWKDNINEAFKYVWLAPGSSFRGKSDLMKFETARQLKKKVDQIRADYTDDLDDSDLSVSQRATALYFIDKLALRVGNEKDPDESADTVGCCSLRVEHVKLENKTKTIHFDFLGKDSIRYQNSVVVTEKVFENMKTYIAKKKPNELIFDQMSPSSLNAYLRKHMSNLTAKVFRTFNASYTLEDQLKKPMQKNLSVAEKLLFYNRANREVAILCNHQRTVSKNFDIQVKKIDEQLEEARERLQALQKAKKEISKLGYDRVKEKWNQREEQRIEEWQAECDELEAQAVKEGKTVIRSEPKKNPATPSKGKKKATSKKTDEDDNDSEDNDSDTEASQQPATPSSAVASTSSSVSATASSLSLSSSSSSLSSLATATSTTTISENIVKLPKKPARRSFPKEDKFSEAIAKAQEKLKALEANKTLKEDLKQVALGTSKINYLDPRITVAWCKKYSVPIDKIFNKSLLTKFPWAMDIDEDFEF